MNRMQFFTESMASTLRQRLAEQGVELPVVGMVNDPEPQEARVEVRVEDVEEIIPGNETYRLECQVVVSLAATSLSAEEIKQLLGAVGKASREVLSEPWRRRALVDPRAEFDPEYAAAPFLVLDLFTEAAPPEVSSAGYEGVLAFRAYVQF